MRVTLPMVLLAAVMTPGWALANAGGTKPPVVVEGPAAAVDGPAVPLDGDTQMILVQAAEGATWYDKIKTWQTGIGAFAGLLAILAGALVNAKINRRRDTRLRNQEIRGLCRALAAELIDSAKKLRATAGSVENAVKKPEYLKLEDFKDHYYPVTDIYRANLDKIGLFGELARDVVEVYEHLSVARGDTKGAAKTLKNAEDLARRLEAYDPPED